MESWSPEDFLRLYGEARGSCWSFGTEVVSWRACRILCAIAPETAGATLRARRRLVEPGVRVALAPPAIECRLEELPPNWVRAFAGTPLNPPGVPVVLPS